MNRGLNDVAADSRSDASRSTLALVLTGGGSKGALQVGMYRALCEVGLEPDFIVGTCDRCGPKRVGIGDVIGRAFSIAADCTLRRMAEDLQRDPDLLLLQPDLGEQIYALDFSHSARLVQAGYEYALPRLREWAGDGAAPREPVTAGEG